MSMEIKIALGKQNKLSKTKEISSINKWTYCYGCTLQNKKKIFLLKSMFWQNHLINCLWWTWNTYFLHFQKVWVKLANSYLTIQLSSMIIQRNKISWEKIFARLRENMLIIFPWYWQGWKWCYIRIIRSLIVHFCMFQNNHQHLILCKTIFSTLKASAWQCLQSRLSNIWCCWWNQIIFNS